MRFLMISIFLMAFCLAARADVSQLVRSGNGFVYDVPKVTELELEVSNEFPTGEEFPQDAIPVAPSDAELGLAEEPEEPEVVAETSITPSKKLHGYKYQVPSRRFKS
ncbi:uncharacterized protein LOC128259347 [Drosophila gunungcola]|uniref:Uncharacterized protein n=2 Tax=elegans subgroup (in: flies) TaxID=32348 RepID=A0A9Q0BQT0_9MUSC|nr:uncharacterized protein LOC128257982 [Drosophila gunungcola]XP_052847622.1 uncharacterized protein LOC128259347 [Drosophila gunungcola]KAI8039117.1 hypothetical protein M5D96_007834 [Drosophila gunungcola]KAI8041312.1 hypothetical protein M5D96_005569 [Drosophila gunungcola]